MRDSDGRIVGALNTFRDMTEIQDLRRRAGEIRSFAGIIGADHKMLAIFDVVRQVAQSDFPVLIQGESGTGKELVANAIHAESPRASGPFVPVNCGALPETILESELF
ncbi:MAG: sigma 54-interacting transcriptional regulator, partial [Planctomycetes bacterium]|nr:sigma 54-interacting transcriptional regulator [Planctomycetota bacterium]